GRTGRIHRVRLRERGPERLFLERDRAAAALLLRDHAVDVADADPVLLDADPPLRVILRLRPLPRRADRREIDRLHVEGFFLPLEIERAGRIAVELRRNRAADPGLDVHVHAEGGTDELVPEVAAPLAVLRDQLEGLAAARLEVHHVRVAGRVG